MMQEYIMDNITSLDEPFASIEWNLLAALWNLQAMPPEYTLYIRIALAIVRSQNNDDNIEELA